jgi:hypothetical protein
MAGNIRSNKRREPGLKSEKSKQKCQAGLSYQCRSEKNNSPVLMHCHITTSQREPLTYIIGTHRTQGDFPVLLGAKKLSFCEELLFPPGLIFLHAAAPLDVLLEKW